MKYIAAITLLLSISFFSCKKETAERPASGVLIRIKNSTINNFLYSSTSNEAFGPIAAGGLSAYKSFSQVIAYPGARIVITTDTIYAGYYYCGTPPLPMLEDGKYRLEIKPDATAPNQFSAEYINE